MASKQKLLEEKWGYDLALEYHTDLSRESKRGMRDTRSFLDWLNHLKRYAARKPILVNYRNKSYVEILQDDLVWVTLLGSSMDSLARQNVKPPTSNLLRMGYKPARAD